MINPYTLLQHPTPSQPQHTTPQSQLTTHTPHNTLPAPHTLIYPSTPLQCDLTTQTIAPSLLQVSVLQGVSQVFSNNLTLAEDNLKEALAQLELQGVEMEVLFIVLQYDTEFQFLFILHLFCSVLFWNYMCVPVNSQCTKIYILCVVSLIVEDYLVPSPSMPLFILSSQDSSLSNTLFSFSFMFNIIFLTFLLVECL